MNTKVGKVQVPCLDRWAALGTRTLLLALKISFLYQSQALILPTRLRDFLAATKAGKQVQERHFAARGPFDW